MLASHQFCADETANLVTSRASSVTADSDHDSGLLCFTNKCLTEITLISVLDFLRLSHFTMPVYTDSYVVVKKSQIKIRMTYLMRYFYPFFRHEVRYRVVKHVYYPSSKRRRGNYEGPPQNMGIIFGRVLPLLP